MNPRRLDGGSEELASIILRNLQGAFPGVEFSVVPLDQTEFGVYWRYKAPGAPTERDIRLHLAAHWPSIDAKLRDSDERTLARRTAGPPNLSALMQLLKPAKRKSTKACRRCGSEQRRGAAGCSQCGAAFPQCAYCSRVLQEEDKYCSKCGLMRCSYV
jgi:hypothetical protein